MPIVDIDIQKFYLFFKEGCKMKKVAFIMVGDEMNNIKTSRLTLGNFRGQDVYALYSYRSLPSVEKYQSWKNYSYDEASSLIENMKDRVFVGECGIYQWGIYLEQQLIGDLFWELEKDGLCWIGYTLDPHYWHQGYAYEAISSWLNYLHFVFHIQTFMAYILKENQASIRLIYKLGFKKIAEEVYIKNEW